MTTTIALVCFIFFVIALFVIRRNLADKNRLLEVLRENEERTRTILNTAVNGIITIDEEIKIIFVNKSAERIFGYSENELLGKNVSILMPEPFHSEHDLYVQNYIKNGHACIIGIGREVLGKRKDGSIFPMDLSVSESMVSGKRLFTGIICDITERKLAEEALLKSEERLNLALRAANIGTWDWDIQKNKLVWDDSMYTLYGIRKDEFNGAFDAWARTIHPEDRNRAEAEIQAALEGEREYECEFRINSGNGNIRYIKANSKTYYNKKMMPVRMIGTNYDITERKQAEEKLRTAYEMISSDIEAAAAIQKDLLPVPATINNIRFEWLFLPSSLVAGDIFNYFQINEDCVGFYLLDVSGHGVPAAMLSASMSWMLSNMMQNEGDNDEILSRHQMLSPAKVLARLNNIFQEARTAGQYIAMIYGVFNCRSNRLTISQAGLPVPVYCNLKGVPIAIGDGGFPVGLVPDASYCEETIDFYPGDRLFLYSDGITECFNADSIQFSDDRLIALIETGAGQQLDNLLVNIENSLRTWRGKNTFDDDITLLAMERV